MANLARGAIQWFEQPHRFAASNGSGPARHLAARTPSGIVIDFGPSFLWRWTAAVHWYRREARILRAERRPCKRCLAEFVYRVI